MYLCVYIYISLSMCVHIYIYIYTHMYIHILSTYLSIYISYMRTIHARTEIAHLVEARSSRDCLKMHQSGVQWKQGVVIYMMLDTT